MPIEDIIDKSIPTDLFYACLDGLANWNANKNSKIGEMIFDNPDRIPEVYISRLPLQSAEQAIKSHLTQLIIFRNLTFCRLATIVLQLSRSQKRTTTTQMGTKPYIQQKIFQEIKEKFPASQSFVHEIAETLGLSYDSAYRRIRGDKEISVEELHTLTRQYNLSLDEIFNPDSQLVNFQCAPLDSKTFKVKDWLGMVLRNIKAISEAREKEIIYAAKDVPVFHYFQIPEIAAFKVFFWEKTLFQFPEYDEKYFRLDEIDPEVIRIGQQALFYATKVPAKEIWNQDTFNIMLRQIEYYWISGIIRKKEDALQLIDKVEQWIHHVHKQAEQGSRLMFEQTTEGLENSFQLYENEVVLSDNTILATVDGKTTVYLTFNVLSLLVTHDSVFAQHISKYLNGLLRKSNLISLYGARDRNRFFHNLYLSIEALKSRINH